MLACLIPSLAPLGVDNGGDISFCELKSHACDATLVTAHTKKRRASEVDLFNVHGSVLNHDSGIVT